MSERYRVINVVDDFCNTPDSLVQPIKFQILYDNNEEKTLLRLSFRNFSKEKVKSITLNIECYDSLKNKIQELKDQNLFVKEDGERCFGKESVFTVTDGTVFVRVLIGSITFESGKIWTNTLSKIVTVNPSREILDGNFGNEVKMNLKKNGLLDKNDYKEIENFWLCSCGQLNTEQTCVRCKANREKLIDSFNEEKIKSTIYNTTFSSKIPAKEKIKQMERLGTYGDAKKQAETIKKAKNKKTRKVLIFSALAAIVLVAVIMISLVAIDVNLITNEFVFEKTSDGEYELKDYKGKNTDVIIPATYCGHPVTSIENWAFDGCSSLTSITIPDSITSIGENAFSGCSSLTSVYYKGDIASWCGITFGYFESNPLRYAHNLYIDNELIKDIVIPDTVTEIKENAFYGWNGTSITIPDSVTSIGDWVFSGCSSLTSITLGNSITSIGIYAFSSCSSLTSITIPDSVTSIGESAFSGCPIKTATIPSIACPFINNSNLKTVIITSGKSIGNSAFYNCSSLTSITIPDGVTSIGKEAFSGCSSLTSVTIGNSVTSIESYAFSGCTATIAWGKNPAITTIGTYAFSGYNGTSITIPDSVTSIGYEAFEYCRSLTSITIPASVTSIGSYAFSGCTATIAWEKNPAITTIGNYAFSGYNGTSITIPDSVTSIGYYAFYNCPIETATIPTFAISYIPKSNLKTVVITSGESIGYGAFSGCSSLTSITIPDSVTSIGSYAFSNCSSLQYNEYDNGYYLGNDNNPYLWLIKAKDTSITSCTIHEDTKFIHSDAFKSCSSLTSITIPASVTSIGESAFEDCSSLTSITIPDSVTSIGDDAFEDCSSLTSITIPDSVTSIGDDAFEDCSSLTSITIGNSVMSIGRNAFSGCSSLTSVYYTGDIASWCGITFDRGYWYEISNPLRYAHNLYIDNELIKDIVIPDTVTEIKENAFYGWNGTSITIPDSVTSIGYEAFRYCSSLKSITIGNSVTSIGSSAFEYCSSLKSITFQGTKAQWNAIEKGSSWNNYNIGSYTYTVKVYCKDGIIY